MTNTEQERGSLRSEDVPVLRAHSLKFVPASKKNYTVLLLYPEYLTKQYGIDTILLWVKAVTPSDALWKAQLDAVGSQILPVRDPRDFRRLGVFNGYIEDVGE